MEIIITAIFVVVMMGIVLVPMAMWRGFVLSKLWLWFIVPTFNAPALSLTAAIGLSILVGMFTYGIASQYSDKDKTSGDEWKGIGNGFLYPLISLGFGYVVTLFM